MVHFANGAGAVVAGVTCKRDGCLSGMRPKVRPMLPYRYRTFAVTVAVTAIAIAAVTVGFLYSGLVSNLLPDSVIFGS